MTRRAGARASAITAVAACVLGVLSASGAGSGTHAWTWSDAAATPGEALARPIAADGALELKQLAEAGQLVLVAGAGSQGVAVGATTTGSVELAPLAAAAGDAPIVAFSDAATTGGTQDVVGVVRADVDRVTATLTDGSLVEVALNEWRAFSYVAATETAAATTLTAFAEGAAVGTVAVTSTATPRLESAPAPAAKVYGALTGRTATSTTSSTATAVLHLKAFDRPARPSDRLPVRLDRFFFVPGRPAGAPPHTERAIDSRRIASYVDGRGRHATLYVARSKTQTCLVSLWRAGAGAGCGPHAKFLSSGELSVSSGHLIFGVVGDDVASVIVVGSQGVRHAVPLTQDGGFIYDCKAFNGCPCVIDHVEARDASGQVLATAFNGPAPSCATARPAAQTTTTTARTRTTSAAMITRYTVSNRGREVPARGRAFFTSRAYKVFLLGSVGGRAFYRLALSPHFNCWGSGKASQVGVVGSMGCPAVVGAYPLQEEDTAIQLVTSRGTHPAPGQHPLKPSQMSYLRFDGIAVDQASAMALVGTSGKRYGVTPIKDNLYSFPGPYPKRFPEMVRLVALDAHGAQLKPHPEWGQHQTPPLGLFGPRATHVSRSALAPSSSAAKLTVSRCRSAGTASSSSTGRWRAISDRRRIAPSASTVF
jgi:hypothetical protein